MLEATEYVLTCKQKLAVPQVLKKRLCNVPELPPKSAVRQFSPEYIRDRRLFPAPNSATKRVRSRPAKASFWLRVRLAVDGGIQAEERAEVTTEKRGPGPSWTPKQVFDCSSRLRRTVAAASH